MNRIFRHKLAASATALAVVAFAGGAYAATQDSGDSQRQAFLNDVAKHLGVTPQALTNAVKSASIDRLQQAVKDGKLTQAQADQLKQEIQSGKGPVPFGLGFGEHRFGFGEHRFGFAFPGVGPFGSDAAAKYLGLTDSQLREQLGSGKTLAQIATSKGKTIAGLKSAMLAAEKSRLDQAVTNKDLTSAQEQQILSKTGSLLDDLINGKPPTPPGMGFRHGFLFRGGPAEGGVPAPPPGTPPGPPPVGY